MEEDDFEHVVEEATLELFVAALTLSDEECFPIDICERTHLPDCGVWNRHQWLTLSSGGKMILEVSECMC